jgi:HlyD family secretion protein
LNDFEETEDSDRRIRILAPIDGHLLRVFQESSAVVTAGMPLMEIGDLRDLEVVVDVLSIDAVKISAGNSVLLEEWGGEHPLHGRVRLVVTSWFMKVSALGVEEQRVNVLVDLVDEFAERRSLGDNFRVEARVIVDRADNVIKIPKGALFRDGEEYAVFVVVDGRAALRHVQVGRRGGLDVEIVDGLADSEKVIVYPSDKIHDGIRVLER